MLGKKRKRDHESKADEDQLTGDEEQLLDSEDIDEGDDSDLEDEQAEDQFDRSEGPYDLSEVEEPDAVAADRLDLGALQLPLIEGLEVRVEMDPETQQPLAVTLVLDEGALQVRVFAAPKSGGGWKQARDEVRSSISGDGGVIDEATGTFGTELHTTAYFKDDAGNEQPQRMRFVGIDGPRWMLQGVILGEGADPDRAAPIEAVLRSLVVARGDDPMPPGAPLTIALPEQVPEGAEIEDSTDEEDD